jgi:threonyl-tRNA synthetase
MAAIRLPDGKELEIEPGEKARDAAEKIGPRLARDAVVAKLDGRLIDLDAPLNGGGEFEVVTKNSPEGLEVLRHSTAHAMAQAILELYPGSKLTLGPPIENGFFYDIEVNGRITDEDLPRIEERMREIVERDLPIEREEVSKAEVERLYADNPYKLEIIEDLEDGDITVYRQGDFFDLCRGPHVPSTGRLGVFRLQNVAGAYWRGDENNPMLTRVYGTAWPTEKDLKAYLARLEEAKERDHRRIGKDLKLFTFSPDVGAGIPLFLPKGETLRHLMEEYVREVQTRYGYEHVWTGHLVNERLYARSGHLEHYNDSMFPPMVDGETRYRLKPMNCPSHMTLYNAEAHSYRDLPLRYAEFATLYRYEKSGELTGLTRVRALTQDDAHIFCTEEQIHEEFARALEIIREVLDTYGFTDYRVRLSLRDPDDPKYLMGDERWMRAGIDYYPGIGEANFYGPKADFMARDVLGREWQLSTIQVDFFQPTRLGCEYVGEDGKTHTPVLLHRAVTGTTERFMAVVIEHYAGAFPVWLSPVQAVVIPVADRHLDYARQVRDELFERGLRVEVDDSQNSMQKKIRENARQKIPYLLIVGDREAGEGTVNVRRRGEREQVAEALEAFANRVVRESASREQGCMDRDGGRGV